MTDPLADAVAETIESNQSTVDGWVDHAPGAWGRLAGQGILAYQRRLGRRLSDGERRRLWADLWRTLDAVREAHGFSDASG